MWSCPWFSWPLFYKALILKGEFDADHTYGLKGYLVWIGSAGKNKHGLVLAS